MLIDFKDEDFESKIKNEDISIIQFSASWCQPCRVLRPILDKLSDEYKDCLLYTSPSPRDMRRSRMPSSA